jgi:hypothetical protein
MEKKVKKNLDREIVGWLIALGFSMPLIRLHSPLPMPAAVGEHPRQEKTADGRQHS